MKNKSQVFFYLIAAQMNKMLKFIQNFGRFVMRYRSTALQLGFLWIGHFLVDLMIGIWPVYKTIIGLDLATAGLIAAICPFIGEGLQMFFGNLGDRGYRRLLCAFGLLFTGANAFLPLTTFPVYLFLLFLATSIGSGAFHPSAAAFASRLTEKKKGLFVAIFASGGGLGMALSQLTFTRLSLGHSSLHPAILFIPIAICFLILNIIPFPAIKPFNSGKRMGWQTIRSLFADRELRYLYLSQVCNQSILWGTIFLLPDILLERNYPSSVALGGGHFFFILGGALAVVPGGYLADRFSIKKVLLTATLISFASFSFFVFSPKLSMPMLFIALLMLGASLGIINPLAVGYGNRLIPSRPGLVSAFLMGLVWCVSEAIGPGLGGFFTKFFTTNAASSALSLIGLLFFLTFFSLNQLPSILYEKPEFEDI